MLFRTILLSAALTTAVLGLAAIAQALPPDRPSATPNPKADRYVAVPGFLKLPAGRSMGSTSAVAGDSKGHIWVVDRCAANDCAGSRLDPVMEFDAGGNFLRAWGAGKFLFPHGFFVDARDHLWITDGHVDKTKGDTVMEFAPNGTLLRTLGKPGVSGTTPGLLHEPNAVLVAPDGSIFVAENHNMVFKGHPRIVKFDAAGKYVKEWGASGHGPGQFGMPHCLALDREGRLYVGDRDNNRIQIFTQDGKYLGQLTQLGRPSGIVIDRNDVIYVTDSESKNKDGYGHHPGWKRGIRIASLKDGVVTDFIPDTYADAEGSSTSGGEGIWADGQGAVYSAQVGQKAIVKYVKR
ncbi:MAG TPA: peptidyl-alpha-hydroxyglycine alpha-amidating lyase family protein [Rhizomicrobium sp.]|jgi:sugar lactone lactonase YvrE|nr:peptidyl-alpha-hydroxyglycine alpha-amidating lyase family protein [Rhizomicrobium sp.]